jgi:hypothetical protein
MLKEGIERAQCCQALGESEHTEKGFEKQTPWIVR